MSNPPVAVLNDLTREQLQQLIETHYSRQIHKNKHCLWCGKGFVANRNWQEFCCDSHRVQHHKHWQLKEIERLEARVRSLEQERDELRLELSRMPPRLTTAV